MSDGESSGRHLFTSESVSMGHPDKVSDQVSDALLDSLIAHDPQARTAIETLVTTNLVVVAGEVTVHTPAAEQALKDVESTIRQTLKKIGYNDPSIEFDCDSCEIISRIHAQSPDISQGVTAGEGLHAEQGAGDQGLMFGFACKETKALMPLPIHLSHRLVERLATARETGKIPWLQPDAKSQVTVAYENDEPVALHTIVVSTQHTEDALDPNTNQMSNAATNQIIDEVIKPVIQSECPNMSLEGVTIHINPTGKFLIGGPHGDCGLTGRKIIVDTYGGRGRHGGGAFSGKDPSKVDRSATYMARYIAKNIVAAGLADQCEVQLAYAIGIAEPINVSVNTFGSSTHSDENLERAICEVFPLTPAGLIEHLNLKRPIFFETARHGHFGREGDAFTWEKTDKVEELQNAVRALQAV